MHPRLAGLAIATLLALTTLVGPIRSAQAVCHHAPPDYPGCTVGQAAQREAPTKKLTHHRYKHARWGQSRNEWANLRPGANEVLRREYRQAVRRYHRVHAAKSGTGKSAWPRHRTWAAFKRASADGCAGQFGAMPAAWCWFDRKINGEIRRATARTVKVTLTCGGVVAITRWGEHLDDKLVTVAVRAARLGIWRPHTVAACVAAVMYTDAIKALFPLDKVSSGLDHR